MITMNVWQALAYAKDPANKGHHITVNGRPAIVQNRTFRYRHIDTVESTARPQDGRRFVRSNNAKKAAVSVA